MRTATINVRT